MVGFLTAIPIIGMLFEKVGDAIDNNVTSDHERLQMKAELMSLQVPVLTAVMEAQKHANEMQVRLVEAELKHEHWLVWSRRPVIAYLSLLNFVAAAVYGHMNTDTALWFAMLVNGLDTGTRGVEKIARTLKTKDQI